jgi:hypothetical protein
MPIGAQPPNRALALVAVVDLVVVQLRRRARRRDGDRGHTLFE